MATHRVHDVYPNRSRGAAGGKILILQFLHSKHESLRLEYGYSSHHTETDHM